jgi:hypothetical protein
LRVKLRGAIFHCNEGSGHRPPLAYNEESTKNRLFLAETCIFFMDGIFRERTGVNKVSVISRGLLFSLLEDDGII